MIWEDLQRPWIKVIAHAYRQVNRSKSKRLWSETTLNYWKMLKRYPNLKEEVGGMIPGCEIYLTKHLQGGQLSPVLWRWHVDLLSQKRKRKNSLKASTYDLYTQVPHQVLLIFDICMYVCMCYVCTMYMHMHTCVYLWLWNFFCYKILWMRE